MNVHGRIAALALAVAGVAACSEDAVVIRSERPALELAPDTEAPAFAGLERVERTSPTALRLFWTPASDAATPAPALAYVVYVTGDGPDAVALAPEEFFALTYGEVRGTDTAVVPGLAPGRTYTLAVRARDLAGNVDANTRLVTATVPAAPVEAPPQVTGGGFEPGGGGAGPIPPRIDALTLPPTVEGGEVEVLFGADPATTTVHCALDGGLAAPCTSPWRLQNLTDGYHSLVLTPVAPDGTVGAPWIAGFMVDLGTAAVTIFQAPPPITTDTGTTFRFLANEHVAGSRCQVDERVYDPCVSPRPVTGLGLGTHLFTVTPHRHDGAPGPSTAWAWTVVAPDSGLPALTLTDSPAGQVTATAATIAYEPNGAVAAMECTLDGVALADCGSPLALTGLAEGVHAVVLTPFGADGGQGLSQVVVWSIALGTPALVNVAGPGARLAATAATVTFGLNATATAADCVFDGLPLAPCTSPLALNGLAETGHHLSLTPLRSDGLRGAPVSVFFTVDLGIPGLVLLDAPNGITHRTDATITFAPDATAATVECRLDGGPAAVCTSPWEVSGLDEGGHLAELTPLRADGVRGRTVTAFFTVDLGRAGIASVTAPAAVTDGSVAVAFSLDATAVSATCAVDGGPAISCDSPWQVEGLADGEHMLTVTPHRADGRAGTAAAVLVRVDRGVAGVTVVEAPAGTRSVTTATVVFALDGTAVAATCALDGGPAAACSSPWNLSGLGEGVHAATVVPLRVDGEAGPAAWVSWAVDLGIAGVEIVVQPPPLSPLTTATIGFALDATATGADCRLDDGPAVDCASPWELVGLDEGGHLATITPRRGDGRPGAAVVVAWTVSLGTAAVVDLSVPPRVASDRAEVGFALNATAAAARCAVGDRAAVACTSPWEATGLAEGPHLVAVTPLRSDGLAGAVAHGLVEVDLGVPEVVVDAAPEGVLGTGDATVAFHLAGAADAVECAVDGGASEACESPYEVTGLGEGSHVIELIPLRADGERGRSVLVLWSVKLGHVSVTVTDAPPAVTRATEAAVGFVLSEHAGGAECRLDDGVYVPCASPVVFTDVTEGIHLASVRALDAAGNPGPGETVQWTVDRTPPVPVIEVKPQALHSPFNAGFTFSAPDATGYRCAWDGGVESACASPDARSDVGSGAHSFALIARDAAGNWSSPVTHSWVAPDCTVPGRFCIAAGMEFAHLVSGAATADRVAFQQLRGAAADSDGTLYVADSAGNRIYRIRPTGAVEVVAGTGIEGLSADGVDARISPISAPWGLDVIGQTLYYASNDEHCIRTVDLVTYELDTLAGICGTAGYRDDDWDNALFGTPRGIVAREVGTVYVAEVLNDRIRRIRINGTVDTYVGGGTVDEFDGSDRLEVRLQNPTGLDLSPSEQVLYFTDLGSQRVYLMDSADHKVFTVVGDGTEAFVEGAAATNTGLDAPVAVAVDPARGGVWAATTGDHRVIHADGDGFVHTMAGGMDVPGNGGDFGPGPGAPMGQPWAVVPTPDGSGAYFISDRHVRFVGDGQIVTVAGPAGDQEGAAGGLPATLAPSGSIGGVAAGEDGLLFYADNQGRVLYRVEGGVQEIVASFDHLIVDIAYDPGAGRVYAVSAEKHRIWSVDLATGELENLAGTGSPGYAGDGGQANSATLNGPRGIAYFENADHRRLYVADTDNHCIRYVDLSPEPPTMEHYGGECETAGHADGSGTSIRFDQPRDVFAVAEDAGVNEVLYVADFGNAVIRRLDFDVNPDSSTIAGTPGSSGKPVEGQDADGNPMREPTAVAVDAVTNRIYMSFLNDLWAFDEGGTYIRVAGTDNRQGGLWYAGGWPRPAHFSRMDDLDVVGGVLFAGDAETGRVYRFPLR